MVVCSFKGLEDMKVEDQRIQGLVVAMAIHIPPQRGVSLHDGACFNHIFISHAF